MRKKDLNLLVAEDDPNLGRLLVANLRNAGFSTTLETDGISAKRTFAAGMIDLSILDVMLPKKDGFTLASELREMDPNAAFIFLTARNTKQDKLSGFQAGCDDYITKPFDLDELLCRINAVLERTHGPRQLSDAEVSFGRYQLNMGNRRLRVDEKSVALTQKEAMILHLLALNVDRTVTRSELMRRVWGTADPYHSKSLDVYLTRIRKYLRMDDSAVLTNIYGSGYRMELVTTG